MKLDLLWQMALFLCTGLRHMQQVRAPMPFRTGPVRRKGRAIVAMAGGPFEKIADKLGACTKVSLLDRQTGSSPQLRASRATSRHLPFVHEQPLFQRQVTRCMRI